jgi:hypothetical protein
MAAPTSVWGAALLRGYALEPAPLFTSELITGVNVPIARDDDTGCSVSGTATYGNPSVSRYNACGGDGVTGTYPGCPGCPNVDFDYTWNTGVSSVTGAFHFERHLYGNVQRVGQQFRPMSNAISATFAVDNQTPRRRLSGPSMEAALTVRRKRSQSRTQARIRRCS